MKLGNNSTIRVRNLPSYGPFIEIENPNWNRGLAHRTSLYTYQPPKKKVNDNKTQNHDNPKKVEEVEIPTIKIQDPEVEVYTCKELIESKEFQPSYLMGNIFPSVGIGAIVADSDIGKSTIARELAIRISTGANKFLGFPLNIKYRKAILLAAEDVKEDVSECLADQVKGLKIKTLPEKFKILFNAKAPLKSIEDELKKEPADLVIIDTFIHLTDGKMQFPNTANKIFIQLRRIAEKYKCFILIISHDNKIAAKSGPSKHNSFGTVYIVNNLRIQIELIKDSDNPDIIYFCIVKGNKIRESEKKRAYKLKRGDYRLFHNTGERIPLNEIGARKKDPTDRKTSDKNPSEKRRGKLSEEKITEIISRLEKGEKQTVLAQEYGVTQGAISQLWNKYQRDK